MASRYWVGGTGTWDGSATTHWSATSGGSAGASVPTGSDAVIFDASSGGGTVTVNSTRECASLTTTGYTGTINGTVYAGGNITLGSGGTYTGLTLGFNKSTGGTLTSNGKTIAAFLAGVNTTYTITFADALAVSGAFTVVTDSTGGTVTFTSGTTSTVGSVAWSNGGGTANLTFNSSSSGSQATLSDSSGTNSLDYWSAQDLAFTGGATWSAGTGFVNNGNLTGLATSSSGVNALFALSLA